MLFESGAIVLHIGATLRDVAARPIRRDARAGTAWDVRGAEHDRAARSRISAGHRSLLLATRSGRNSVGRAAEEAAKGRLADLAAALDGREYLEGHFTAGDLLMTTVLRILRHTDLVARSRPLAAYQTRCEARPAFPTRARRADGGIHRPNP